MPRSRHRSGRPYRRARRVMFATYGTACHICGHGGAREADHLEPISLAPDQPIDPDAMRPAHGATNACRTCGRKCNQERGAKPLEAMFRPRLDW